MITIKKYIQAYHPVANMQLNITYDQSSPIRVCNTVVTDQTIVSKFYLGTVPFI